MRSVKHQNGLADSSSKSPNAKYKIIYNSRILFRLMQSKIITGEIRRSFTLTAHSEADDDSEYCRHLKTYNLITSSTV